MFTFMNKFNELIEEGINKICKGRFDNVNTLQNESWSSIDDTIELWNYFSDFS